MVAKSLEPTPTPVITSANGITTVIVHLSPEEGEGQVGSAKFVSDEQTTTVEVEVDPPFGEAQPIHIHTGVCDDVGSVLHALDNVIRGSSVTIINSPLSEIISHGVLVNVHASYTDPGTYTSCGKLPETLP